MTTVDTTLGALYVDDRGEPDEPTALLWPSLFTDHRMWRHQIAPLREAGWRTLALDPPGHGRSPGPSHGFTMDECAEAAVQVLDATGVRSLAVVLGTYLYTLTLSATGVPALLRPWTVPVVNAEIDSLSASADGGTLAFVQAACRGPDQQIGIIRGGRTKTWREPYPLFADDLSLSAAGSKLVYAESTVAGRGARVRVLDTGSAPASAPAVSTIVHTYPAAGRAPSAAIGPDFTVQRRATP